MSIKKRDFLIIILGTLLALSFFTSFKLVRNHNRFLELNAAMAEGNMDTYDPNNLLVKDETLEEMNITIKTNIEKFDNWYDENITLTKEKEKEKDELLTEETQITKEDVSELKKVYTEDLTAKNMEKKNNVTDLIDEKIDYNQKEEKTVTEYEEELDSIEVSNNLEASLESYEELNDLNQEVSSLNKKAATRIEEEEAQKKEEEEAQKKEEEEAQKKEEEEAQKKEEEEAQAALAAQTIETYSTPAVASGNFDTSYEMAIFNSVNNYRASYGLSPYSYNSSMQSCVDSEASAYASNNVPHNYICQPISAENAASAVTGYLSPDDIVNMWKQDSAHNTPMISSSFTSMAVSVYNYNGMLYIEACFW